MKILVQLSGRDLVKLESSCQMFHVRTARLRGCLSLTAAAARKQVLARIAPATVDPPSSWPHLLCCMRQEPQILLRRLNRHSHTPSISAIPPPQPFANHVFLDDLSAADARRIPHRMAFTETSEQLIGLVHSRPSNLNEISVSWLWRSRNKYFKVVERHTYHLRRGPRLQPSTTTGNCMDDKYEHSAARWDASRRHVIDDEDQFHRKSQDRGHTAGTCDSKMLLAGGDVVCFDDLLTRHPNLERSKAFAVDKLWVGSSFSPEQHWPSN